MQRAAGCNQRILLPFLINTQLIRIIYVLLQLITATIVVGLVLTPYNSAIKANTQINGAAGKTAHNYRRRAHIWHENQYITTTTDGTDGKVAALLSATAQALPHTPHALAKVHNNYFACFLFLALFGSSSFLLCFFFSKCAFNFRVSTIGTPRCCLLLLLSLV